MTTIHGRNRSSTSEVVLATSQVGIGADASLAPILELLGHRGIEATAVPWDEPRYDWSACRSVIIMSTWDYGPRLGEYLAWVERVAAVTRLHNPDAVVRWNSDKRYLTDLDHMVSPWCLPTSSHPATPSGRLRRRSSSSNRPFRQAHAIRRAIWQAIRTSRGTRASPPSTGPHGNGTALPVPDSGGRASVGVSRRRVQPCHARAQC